MLYCPLSVFSNILEIAYEQLEQKSKEPVNLMKEGRRIAKDGED